MNWKWKSMSETRMSRWTQNINTGLKKGRATAVWVRAELESATKALVDLCDQILFFFFFPLQNVHILPQTVLYMADSENFINLEECRGHKRGEQQRTKFGVLLFPCAPLFGDEYCFHPESYWLSEAVGLLPEECMHIVSLNFWGSVCVRDCTPCSLKIQRFYPEVPNAMVHSTQGLWRAVFSFRKTSCAGVCILLLKQNVCLWLFQPFAVLDDCSPKFSGSTVHSSWLAKWRSRLCPMMGTLTPELRLSGLSLCDLIPDDCALEKSWFRISLTERIVHLKSSGYCLCHWGKSSMWTTGKDKLAMLKVRFRI